MFAGSHRKPILYLQWLAKTAIGSNTNLIEQSPGDYKIQHFRPHCNPSCSLPTRPTASHKTTLEPQVPSLNPSHKLSTTAMHFPTLANATAALSGVVSFHGHHNKHCLTSSKANEIAQTFGGIIQTYNNDVATALFADDFTDYSGSIQSLKNGGCLAPFNLTAPAFATKQQFQTESAGQPSVPFKVENVWFTCDVITVRWSVALKPQVVGGVSILETRKCKDSKYGWLIKRIFAEFNSAAWLADIGKLLPGCPKEDGATLPGKREEFSA
ncbi:hypothetical protein LTR95_004365 [Oleoguttula sp. CCFEE 5521]